MDFRYFTADPLDTIYQAAMASGLVAPHNRALLAAGINPGFFYSRPTLPDPASQLRSDLNEFNRVEQLADGSVPLQIWLRNAHRITADQGLPQSEVFASHLDQLGRTVRGEPTVVADPAAIPELKERIVVENDMLPVSFLAGGARVGRSVARLRIPQYEGGVRAVGSTGVPLTHRGTGWLITPTLLITNHHVVNARLARDGAAPLADPADLARQVAEAEVLFDYDFEDQEGVGGTATELVAYSADVELDYAIMRVAPCDRPGLTLHPAPIEPGRFAVNIVQHPNGGPKTVGLRNNLVTGVAPRTLRYLTDTLGGSSGAPVCDDRWRVIALHRGSQRFRADYNGKQVAWVNVGTPLADILVDLKTTAPTVAEELLSAE